MLGENVEADGYFGRLVRVVTHAHSDHMLGLPKSARRALFIVATPTTLEMLRVLGHRIPSSKEIPLKYGRGFMVEDEIIRLYPARHIAGSAQVLVERGDCRVGYTGDFKMPGTPPMRDLDVIVIDATYGNPRAQRRWSDWEALMALIGLIEESIVEGPVLLYGYNGKLQEVMVELRRNGVPYPFLATPRTLRLAEIAARFYGVDLGQVSVYNGGPVEEPAIVFLHASSRRRYRRLPGTHILLTGWEMRGIVVRTGDNSYNVSYSDHATLKEIVEYLLEARPRLVVVDAYRGREAVITARYIERYVGLRALAMPPSPAGVVGSGDSRAARAGSGGGLG